MSSVRKQYSGSFFRPYCPYWPNWIRWLCLILATMVAFTMKGQCTGYRMEGNESNYVSNERRLYDHLTQDYNPSIRPVQSENDTLTVDLTLSFVSFEDIDEKNQALKVNVWLKKTWKDFELTWDPSDFGGVNDIRLPIASIWYPDITVLNSKDAFYSPPLHHYAHVTHDGTVLWVPPVNLETHCDLDMSEFPFDEHTCPIIFMSWVYPDKKVNVTSSDLARHYVDISLMTSVKLASQTEWKVNQVAVERNSPVYPCCPNEYYPDITYRLTAKRRTGFATHLFIGPSVMLCLITPVIFLLPPGSSEKMTLGVGLLISDTLLLGELIDFVPAAHPNLPLIAKYFLANIVLTSLSLAISAIIIGFWNKSNSRQTGPPAFFRLFILGPVATLFCVKQDQYAPVNEPATLEVSPDGEEAPEGESAPDAERRRRYMCNYLRNTARAEWRQLATVFDRLFFVLYFVIIFILTLAFTRYL